MKTTSLLQAIFLLSLTGKLLSQSCYPVAITFANQQDVDDFIFNNPSCTSIGGHVTIQNGITNLDGLAGITHIGGNLTLSVDESASVSGLQNLQSVGGNMVVHNPSPDLSQLSSLSNIIGSFTIYGSENIPGLEMFSNQLDTLGSLQLNIDTDTFNGFNNITSLEELRTCSYIDTWSGFSALESIEYFRFGAGHYNDLPNFPVLTSLEELNISPDCQLITITMNEFPSFPSLDTINNLVLYDAGLVDFSGLDSIEYIGTFYAANASAASYQGLGNLRYIDFAVFAINGPQNFTGLGSLEEVGTFNVSTAWNTVSLDGLNSLVFIEDFLIGNTQHLEDLDGLNPNLQITGNLDISYNLMLSDCSAEAICNYLASPSGSVSISDNLAGCNSETEVMAGCGSSVISGLTYADLNCNGELDANEPKVPGILIRDENQVPIAYSGIDGDYFIYLPDNSSTEIIADSIPGFTVMPHVEITGPDPVEPVHHFGYCPSGQLDNLSVSLDSYWFIPGFVSTYYVCISNHGTEPADASVQFDFSSMPVSDVVYADGGIAFGDTIIWEIQGLNVFADTCFIVKLLANEEAVTGSIVTALASVDFSDGLTSDIHNSDNITNLSQEVISSFDPNDKQVSQEWLHIDSLANGSTLHYTIRFQNTGTAPANFVRLVDELPVELDITTIELHGSSHNYEMIFHDDNLIEWYFPDINLPDSTSDLAGSQGYVGFSINLQEGITPGTEVRNKADIYFDYNDPVITNEAVTTIYECPDSLEFSSEPVYCAGSPVQIKTTPGYDTYQWTIDGTTIDGTSEGDFLLDEGGYNVFLNAVFHECNSTINFSFEVLAQPSLDIIYDSPGCNETDLHAVSSSDVEWMYNGEIISTLSETVATQSGIYTVTAVNECGTSSLLVDVEIIDTPSEVDIIVDGSSLVSNEQGEGYIWFLNNNPIEGADSYSYTPVVNGSYSVEVDFGNGCTVLSSPILFVSAKERIDVAMSIKPNPVVNACYVSITGMQGIIVLRLYNLHGDLVSENITGNPWILGTHGLASGAYVLTATDGKTTIRAVLVKE